ncbi:hypothetical protein DXG03_000402 [Asterophora parasitica]|uniref:Uncharacterized protein n=1 Tax=Asterophora parasitica TaxID=117018 RepID=A0A9P7GB96_9AGAR|nr:hypothetical protein DXG03_000402 [Asterophora parasitica]
MTYLAHTPVQAQQPPAVFADPAEKEHRQRAIQKFMARAEISTITRALRTNLSYASYKAAHNIHHVPLRDLEAQSQTQSQSASFSRTIAAKRKAAGNNNYYNNPATQGPHAVGAGSSSGSLRRGGSGSMLPPSTTSSPRTYHPAVNGSAYATTSNNDPGSSSRIGTSKQSLYTSILAPPPAKHARTIHNAGDPPVPASSRPLASPRARATKPISSRSTAEATRSHAKSRKLDHPSSPRSSNTRKAKRSPADKGKQRHTDMGMDVDGDVDMKAAATLTSLLLHHRPSVTGSATSPRSSIDSSEAGSVYSYSHFAQSSARTISEASPPGPGPISAAPSTSTVTEASFRNTTPPPPPPAAGPENSSAPPRPAPTDNEAASLMLYLATSPSPVRPTNANKDSRDLAAYRALGGGPPGVLRDKGRVLFASGSSTEHGPAVTDSPKPKSHTLARGGDTSFTSSISSIGTDVGGGSLINATGTVPAPTQLLPPHSLPTQKPASGASSLAPKAVNESPRQVHAQASVEFNFSDFIHGSPSGPSPSRGPVLPAPKANLGLRADVGRKLFEEEQMRHALTGSQSPGKRREEPRPLGAGIDLVHSS